MIDAFLISHFRLLPDTLLAEPFNFWYPEEKKFIFYLDAIWGKRSKDVQIIEILISEIYDVLNANDEDFMPAGIAKNIRRSLETVDEAERPNLEKQLLQMPHMNKRKRIMDIFDALKQYVDDDRLVAITNAINTEMRKKLVTGGMESVKPQEPVSAGE